MPLQFDYPPVPDPGNHTAPPEAQFAEGGDFVFAAVPKVDTESGWERCRVELPRCHSRSNSAHACDFDELAAIEVEMPGHAKLPIRNETHAAGGLFVKIITNVRNVKQKVGICGGEK